MKEIGEKELNAVIVDLGKNPFTQWQVVRNHAKDVAKVAYASGKFHDFIKFVSGVENVWGLWGAEEGGELKSFVTLYKKQLPSKWRSNAISQLKKSKEMEGINRKAIHEMLQKLPTFDAAREFFPGIVSSSYNTKDKDEQNAILDATVGFIVAGLPGGGKHEAAHSESDSIEKSYTEKDIFAGLKGRPLQLKMALKQLKPSTGVIQKVARAIAENPKMASGARVALIQSTIREHSSGGAAGASGS